MLRACVRPGPTVRCAARASARSSSRSELSGSSRKGLLPSRSVEPAAVNSRTPMPIHDQCHRGLPGIRANRRKSIKDAATARAAARVPGIGWDNEDQTWCEGVGNAVHNELQRAFEHADDLFVWMLMVGKRRAGIDVDPRVRDA